MKLWICCEMVEGLRGVEKLDVEGVYLFSLVGTTDNVRP